MPDAPNPQFVELEDDYYHVRFRDPDEFSEIRTPVWATEAAKSVVNGSKVRTGRRAESDDWVVQSVLVPKQVGKAAARTKGQQILDKIES